MIKLTMVLLAVVLFASCTKSKPPEDLTIEKTNQLTSGTWLLTDYRYWGTFTQTSYSDLPDCRKDDLLSFKNDGSYEMNEGPSKCNTASPQSVFRQWKFLDQRGGYIELDGKDYKVWTLDNTTFDISSVNRDPYASQESFTYHK